MAKIFINYRTGDESFAPVHLERQLSERFGVDHVFRDSNAIAPGQDFRPELWRSLARSAVLLVVIGPRWLTIRRDDVRLIDRPEDYVRQEIAMALRIGIAVVPILVGETKSLNANDLPDDIRDLAFRQYVRLRSRTATSDTRYLVDRLAAVLHTPELDPPADSAPAPAVAGSTVGMQFNDLHAPNSTFIAGDQHNHGDQHHYGGQHNHEGQPHHEGQHNHGGRTAYPGQPSGGRL